MIVRKLLAAACTALVASTAAAADVSQLGLTPAQVEALNAQLTAPVTVPGLSFGSPVAFGAEWGDAFAGIGGQTLRADHEVDGSASLGLGLGDARRYFGVETVLTAISLRNDFAEDGDVSWKLHRALPHHTAIAFGVDNTARWGAAKPVKAGTYAAVSKAFVLAPDDVRNPMPLTLNFGIGNGRFTKPGENRINAFGSVAVAPTRRASVILDWTGRDLNLGVSTIPFPHLPIVLSYGAINLAKRYGRDVEFAAGVGYLFSF